MNMMFPKLKWLVAATVVVALLAVPTSPLLGWFGFNSNGVEGELLVLHSEIDVPGGSFEMNSAVFRVGAGSDGADPPNEVVKLTVGTYSVTLPAGSFREVVVGGQQFCLFDGTINGVDLEMQINPTHKDGEFAIFAEADNANLAGTSTWFTPVCLTIGDDYAEGFSLTF